MNRFRDEFEIEAEPYTEIILSKLEYSNDNSEVEDKILEESLQNYQKVIEARQNLRMAIRKFDLFTKDGLSVSEWQDQFEPDMSDIENWDELNLQIKKAEDQIIKFEKIQSLFEQIENMNYANPTLG